MHVKFKKNGLTREVKAGFSWTVFFFGFIALLFRRQYVHALISFLTFGAANLVYMFIANRLLAQSMAENGWTAIDKTPESWGIAHEYDLMYKHTIA